MVDFNSAEHWHRSRTEQCKGCGFEPEQHTFSVKVFPIYKVGKLCSAPALPGSPFDQSAEMFVILYCYILGHRAARRADMRLYICQVMQADLWFWRCKKPMPISHHILSELLNLNRMVTCDSRKTFLALCFENSVSVENTEVFPTVTNNHPVKIQYWHV